MEEYVDFKFIFKSLYKRFYIIIILLVLGVGISFAYNRNLLTHNKFNATSQLYVKPNYFLVPDNSYDAILATEKITKNYVEIIKSRIILEQVQKDLSFDITLEKLMSNITVTLSPEASIINVGYSNENQDNALEVVKKITNIFLNNDNDLDIDTGNIIILDEGTIKESKNFNNKKNIIVGLSLGLFFGCIIAYCLEIINTKKNK